MATKKKTESKKVQKLREKLAAKRAELKKAQTELKNVGKVVQKALEMKGRAEDKVYKIAEQINDLEDSLYNEEYPGPDPEDY